MAMNQHEDKPYLDRWGVFSQRKYFSDRLRYYHMFRDMWGASSFCEKFNGFQEEEDFGYILPVSILLYWEIRDGPLSGTVFSCVGYPGLCKTNRKAAHVRYIPFSLKEILSATDCF